MAAKKKTSVPADKLKLYERLIAVTHGVEGKSNFGSAYLAVNGNMYSMISKYGVVGIRLPELDIPGFLDKYKTTMFRGDPAWPPSKSMVAVPDDLLANTEELTLYLELSLRHTRTLRPKATKKKSYAPA
jgi:hypothetical protein